MASEAVERTAGLLRDQSAACTVLGSALYGDLLEHAAEDLLAGGPTLAVLDGHLLDPGPSALALRMMAGAHVLALTGQAPELASYYPSAGGDALSGPRGEKAWDALRHVLETHRDAVRTWLTRPPQTNEVGRGAALIGGLRHIMAAAGLPVQLVEVGASAGLNLRADRFHISGARGRYGDPQSPVQLGSAWLGIRPPETQLEIASRRGGDLMPIDPTSESGRLSLSAYVWPDQRERLSRLRGALDLAAQVPADLRQESAIATLRDVELTDGAWTVVWHSVFWQYLSVEERVAIEERLAALGATATPQARLAHLSLEPRRRTPERHYEFLVTLSTWPGGDDRIIGTSEPHGIPVTWE